MLKASERLARLLELSVPEATAQDLIKSGISAGELEDDIVEAPVIDSAKFEKILDNLRKSQDTTEAETLAKAQTVEARDDLPTKEFKRMFDAQSAELKSFADRVSKSIVHLGEMLVEVQTGLVAIDRRHGELTKSINAGSVASPVERPGPRAVLGSVTPVEAPAAEANAPAAQDNLPSLRKSLSDSIRGELSKSGNSTERTEQLVHTLRGVSTANDPRSLAARVGITL